MENKKLSFNPDRRQFIAALVPFCSMTCLGLGEVAAFGQTQKNPPQQEVKHKFQTAWGHTYEEAFRWRYGYYIDIMEGFAKYLGRKKLIEMIKRAVDASYPVNPNPDPDFSFPEWLQGDDYFANMMTWKVIERTDTAYEMKVSECLWAKIFQERKAADIGYATVCHGDFASPKVAHPNITLRRTKTIMEGHGFCDHRWTYQPG